MVKLFLLDFGIMGRIDKINRRFLAEILYGFIKRDYKKVAEVHIVAGLVLKNVPKEEFISSIKINWRANIWSKSKGYIRRKTVKTII